MERFFNTAGPNRPEVEYTIDPLTRFDLDDVLALIADHRGVGHVSHLSSKRCGADD